MNVFNDRGEGRGDGSCDGDATGIHVKSSHIFQSSSRSNSKFNVVTPTFSSLVSPLPPPSSSISPSNGPKREKQENAKKHDVRGSKVISAGGNEQEAQKKEKDKVSFQTKGEVEIEPTPTKSTTTVTIATITKHGDSPDRKKKIDNVSASPSLLTTSLASFRKKRMQEQRREQMKQQQAKQKQKQKEKQKEQQLQQRKYLEQQQQHHQQQHERYKQMQKLSKSCDGCGDADKICAMPGINPNAKVKTNTKTDTRAHTKAKTNAWQTVGASSKRGTVVSQPNPMKNPLVSSLSAPLQSLTQAQKRRLRKKKKGL